jgi:hypothetical protein
LGEATGTAQQARRARGEVLRLAIDPETLSLDPETVVVKPTRDGGYLCLGFRPPAAFLQLDRDQNFAATAPPSAITENVAGGGILMCATSEVFDVDRRRCDPDLPRPAPS